MKMNIMERQIKLDNIQFTEVDYKVKSFDPNVAHELGIHLDFEPMFKEGENKDFKIVFDIGLTTKLRDFKLKIKAIAKFSTNADIDLEFRNSLFISVNAPAIAFPFVRSFISNLTLSSGYDPVILPSFNFVKFSQEKVSSHNG